MNLERRIEQLEQRAGGNTNLPSCIFITALSGAGKEREDEDRLIAFKSGDQRWERRPGESVRELQDRVTATGKGSRPIMLACAEYMSRTTA